MIFRKWENGQVKVTYELQAGHGVGASVCFVS